MTLMRVLSPDQAQHEEELRDELTRIACETLGSDYCVTVIVQIGESVKK